jgi:hypothetical protein
MRSTGLRNSFCGCTKLDLNQVAIKTGWSIFSIKEMENEGPKDVLIL